MTRKNTPPPTAVAPVLAEVPARTRLQIEVTQEVLELLDVVSGVTGSTRTGLVLEALMQALPGFVDRAEAVVLASGKIPAIQARKTKR